MTEPMHFDEAVNELRQAALRLEVRGDILAGEARELESAVQTLTDRRFYLEYDRAGAAANAVLDQLQNSVERDITSAIERIRQMGRTIRDIG